MATQKMYTVDKFLGINEAADGWSELKMGQASRMLNFAVTDGGNITVRPGFARVSLLGDTEGILALWTGFIRDDAYLVAVDVAEGADRITVARKEGNMFTPITEETGLLGLAGSATQVVKIVPFGERVYILCENAFLSIRMGVGGVAFTAEAPYIPTVITGADPMGGGEQLESINLLTSMRRICYSADGKATVYVLPEEATALVGVEADGGALTAEFDAQTHSAVFETPPPEGVTNLVITYDTEAAAAASARKQVTDMPFWEAYNGATDTRLFFYGDGSNVTLYTGVTAEGKGSILYVPAMNEIAVDHSGSPITGMLRNYNKLMVFKPDGASAITYEPVTLPGGDVIAGFYLRTVNKTVGNDCPGQVQLVNNYPRTVSAGALYEWRISASYSDERYAKRVSDAVARSLANADPRRIVTCDDNSTHTYYMFLNDEQGTVLVNRYALNVWMLYRSPLAVGVRQAVMCENTLLLRRDRALYFLDPTARFDTDGEEVHSIGALWESGYLGFGEDYRRKFTSFLWLAVKPESYSAVTVTCASDRKSAYAEKTIRSELFDYGKISYAKWSYDASSAIRTRRVKLKVKKAIYYKLIIKVTEPGAKGTILGYDQLVRFTSLVK